MLDIRWGESEAQLQLLHRDFPTRAARGCLRTEGALACHCHFALTHSLSPFQRYIASCVQFLMAPAPDFPGLEAEVVVEGRALTEHVGSEYPHPNTNTVYVQSEAGEQFGVRYFIPGNVFEQYDIKAIVSIDGTAKLGPIYRSSLH